MRLKITFRLLNFLIIIKFNSRKIQNLKLLLCWSKKVEEKITGEKEIVKLTEEDMSFDAQVREICENIEDNDFDNNVGLLLSKVSHGELK